VTHDQVEAMTMGDRIVVMRDGHIQQVAPPLELYRAPVNTFVATFIGSPPMNLLRGHLSAEENTLLFTAEEGAARLDVGPAWSTRLAAYGGKTITLGIRPERLDLHTGSTTEGDGALHAGVEMVEPMGGETYVYLRLGAQPLTARLRVDGAIPAIGEQLAMTVAPEHMHFFDADTEQAIR
jgi:multiple sugar transport system ATP-binding protein